MKERTIKKKRISKDCWDLDYAFFEWLHERLPVYLKEAGKVCDLEYHEFEHKGKTYTQKELIEYLIFLINDIRVDYPPYEENKVNKVHEAIDVWNKLIMHMWW